MPLALLLAMQAAGMIVDWIGTENQQRLGDMGAKVQQAGIEASIEQTRLETEDASLQAMKNLRQNLGSMAALFAARGTRTGAGNTIGLVTESLGNLNSDERVRRINQLGKENSLRAGGLVSNLQNSSNNSKLWQGFAQRTFSNLPIGSLGSKSSSSSPFSGSKAGASASYGLTRKA